MEYIWEFKKRKHMNEKEIFELLSDPLRDEIFANVHGMVLKLYRLFEKYEGAFTTQLSRMLESETFGPDDKIIEEGELSQKMYFIISGEVDVYHTTTHSSFKTLSDREFFGEIAFFTEAPRCASVKALNFVDMLSLKRSSMNLLLEKYPTAKHTTEQIRRKCLREDLSPLLTHCFICKELGHVAIRCN